MRYVYKEPISSAVEGEVKKQVEETPRPLNERCEQTTSHNQSPEQTPNLYLPTYSVFITNGNRIVIKTINFY